MKKNKVIVNIEDFFHPDAGYQINILSKYMVMEGYKVYILTAQLEKIPEHLTSFFGKDNIEEKDKQFYQKTGVKIIRIPVRRYISGRVIYTNELEKMVSKINPDIIYVHGNDTFVGMQYIWNVRKYRGKLLSDSHMLEMASVNPLKKVYRICYKLFITPKIKKYNIPVIRTQDDDYVERCLGIPIKQCPFISFGTDTLLFHPSECAKEKFRSENKIGENAIVIIYAGKLDESKGGKFLAEAFKEKFENKEVVLVVVGNAVGDYGAEVEGILGKSENRIFRFPTQSYMDLAQFYQVADLAVFPKQCSLSFYDVQASGLPVISEDNNINVDRCRFGNGINFEAGSIGSFREAIQRCVSMSKDELNEMSKCAVQYIERDYDYKEIAKRYMSVIEGIGIDE